MNKKNVLVYVLLIVIVLLCGYIIYDKTFKDNSDSIVCDDLNNNTSNNNSNDVTSCNLDENLKEELEKKFIFAFDFRNLLTHFYCGECEYTDNHFENNYLGFWRSKQFNAYSELLNYLKNYMTMEAISSKPGYSNVFSEMPSGYVESDGNLYCQYSGKDGSSFTGMGSIADYVLNIKNITDNKITAIGKVYYQDDSEYYFLRSVDLEYVKEDNNWLVSKFDIK